MSKFDGATLFYVIDGLVCILLGIVFPATPMSMSSRAPRRFSGKYAKGLLISAGVVILLFCGTGLLRGYAALLLMFAMMCPRVSLLNGELDCDTARYNIQQKIRLMLLAHEIELGDADV